MNITLYKHYIVIIIQYSRLWTN